MKHTIKATIVLLILFVLTQIIGVGVLAQYIDIEKSAETGETVLYYEEYETTYITPPEVENESLSFFYIIIPVAVGTIFLLLIIKYAKKRLWKAWFFLAVLIMLIAAFSPFVRKIFGDYGIYVTVFMALILTYYKVLKKNIFIHNFTELFIYGGLAALFVPILNIISITVVFLLFAVYDAYAVWKSKHMIKMAEFQKSEKLFAGLYFPYAHGDNKNTSEKSKEKNKTLITKGRLKAEKAEYAPREAILGGGDCALPLLFLGVVMKMTGSIYLPFIIIATSSISLAALFLLGEKNKYYPAIPFLAVGCYIGLGIVMLVS